VSIISNKTLESTDRSKVNVDNDETLTYVDKIKRLFFEKVNHV